MQSLAKNLHTLDATKYVCMNEALFSRHVTAAIVPMCEDELEAQIAADRRLQEQLRREGFGASDPSRKRQLALERGEMSSNKDAT